MSVKTLAGVALLLFPLALAAGSHPQPKSFSHAVNIFKKIDFDYARTAFTNELYSYDPTTCMDKLYLKDDHSRSVVFVRIVSEERMGRTRRCWNEKICKMSDGKAYNGARCCRKTDGLYKAFDRDLFNIIPVVEEGGYSFENPPLHIKGNIARVNLYMNAQYGLNLSYEEQMRYLKWHRLDKVDEKECAVHKQIEKIQRRSNPWIKSSCETSGRSFSKPAEAVFTK